MDVTALKSSVKRTGASSAAAIAATVDLGLGGDKRHVCTKSKAKKGQTAYSEFPGSWVLAKLHVRFWSGRNLGERRLIPMFREVDVRAARGC